MDEKDVKHTKNSGQQIVQLCNT